MFKRPAALEQLHLASAVGARSMSWLRRWTAQAAEGWASIDRWETTDPTRHLSCYGVGIYAYFGLDHEHGPTVAPTN